MPKRYQVTLPLWLSDFIDGLTQKSDLNASEITRGLICIGVMTAVTGRWPDFPISFKNLPPEYFIQNFELADNETRQRFWERHDFEAQKALNHYKANIEELIAKVKGE